MGNTELKIGDVVVLKSGGPEMTIGFIIGELVNCKYFIDNQKYTEISVNKNALEKVKIP